MNERSVKTLTVFLGTDGKQISATIYDQDSNTSTKIIQGYDPDCHPEFDGQVGEELYSYVNAYFNERKRVAQKMKITVGHVIDNPTFDFCGWFEITTTDDDGTVHTLYDSYEDMDKNVPAELLIEPVTYMVVNKEKGRLRLEIW